MSTMPAQRPLPTAPRPPTQGPSSAGGVAIDPVKLIQKYKWLLVATAVVGAVLGTVAHFVLLQLAPVWRAQMTFTADPLQGDMKNLGPAAGFEKELDKFMATQVAIMQSQRIIDRTVEDPRLQQMAPKFAQRFLVNGVFDTREASRILQKRVSAGVMGETTFIRLSVWDPDKETATALTELVGNVYLADRQRQFESSNSDRVKSINDSINEFNTKIEQARAQRKRLLQDQSVDSLDSNFNEATMRMRNIQLELLRIRSDKETARSQRDEMERQLASPAGRSFSDRIRARVEENPLVLRLRQDVDAMRAELSSMKTRLGPTHRSALDLDARLAATMQTLEVTRQQKLAEQFDAELDSLKTAISSSEAAETDLVRRLEDASKRAEELTQTLSQVKDLDREIDLIQLSVQRYQDDLKSLDVLTGRGRDSRVRVVDRPTPPRVISFPRLVFMLPVGVMLTLGLVAGVVLLREILDQRVKSPADVALIPRTRVLGLVPHASEDPGSPQKLETVFRDLPRGVLAESYRQLRGALMKKMQQSDQKSLVIMSGMPGSGATTVAVNLAHAIAVAEHKVLLIDANFRRPNVHKILGLPEAPGLAEVLSGAMPLEAAARETGTPGLHVLAAGAASKRVYERLSSTTMGELLKTAGQSYDFILIDVAPAMVAGDAVSLANRADASLLVVRALGEKRGMVARLRNELTEHRAEFLGVVVNAVRSAAGGYLRGNIMAAHAYENGQNEPTKES